MKYKYSIYLFKGAYLISFLIFIYSCYSCKSGSPTSPTTSTSSTSSTTTTTVAITTVYITATGNKYHLDGCSYLSESKIAISLVDACKKGYGPCSVCKPPPCPDSFHIENNAGSPILLWVRRLI
jgi:hypothetical protein